MPTVQITAPSTESATLTATMTTLESNITAWLAAADALSPKDTFGARRALLDFILRRCFVAGLDAPIRDINIATSATPLASRSWSSTS